MTVANIYTIADLDNMQVIGNVDEADIGQVKVGQSVTFSVDAYPDELFEGNVTQVRLNPTTESNVVTYEVVVNAPNPEHKLIPGLTANLTIYVMREQDVLLLPTKVFTFEPRDTENDKNLPQAADNLPVLGDNQKLIWVVDGNRLVPTAVTTGASNGIKTEITAGIADGAVVAEDYEMAALPAAASDNERSPFAPQPPGRNKKK